MLTRLEPDRDEITRLQFRCASLERRIEGEQNLRESVAMLETQASHLGNQLQAARAERENLISAVRSIADLNRRSIDHIRDIYAGELA